MTTSDLRHQVSAISNLISQANLLLSELEIILQDMEDAEEEAIESQGKSLNWHDTCDGTGNNGDKCSHPDHR